MRRLFTLFILLPIAVVVVMLSVANRGAVTFSIDPVGAAASSASVRAPLFAVLFVAVAAGMVIGGVATWVRQGRWRHAARIERANAERLRRETTQLRDQIEQMRPALPHRPGNRDAA